MRLAGGDFFEQPLRKVDRLQERIDLADGGALSWCADGLLYTAEAPVGVGIIHAHETEERF